MGSLREKIYSSSSILLPSFSGVIVYVVLSLFTLVLQQLPAFYHYFSIPAGWHVGDFILTILSNILLSLLGTSATDTLILSLFWVVIGLVVYLCLRAAVAFVVEAARDMTDEKYVQPTLSARPQSELRRFVERSLLRVAMVAGGIVYLTAVIGFFLRGQVHDSTRLGRFMNHHGVAKSFIMLIGEILALHGFTIILRLILLKHRLFE